MGKIAYLSVASRRVYKTYADAYDDAEYYAQVYNYTEKFKKYPNKYVCIVHLWLDR